jgi:hypothetical protein
MGIPIESKKAVRAIKPGMTAFLIMFTFAMFVFLSFRFTVPPLVGS